MKQVVIFGTGERNDRCWQLSDLKQSDRLSLTQDVSGPERADVGDEDDRAGRLTRHRVVRKNPEFAPPEHVKGQFFMDFPPNRLERSFALFHFAAEQAPM